MPSDLWQKTNYIQDLSFLKSCNIFEYDISKANINMLYYYGKIDEAQYRTYMNMDNHMRKVLIGLMEKKNRNLIKIKADGIKHFKQLFFEKYDLNDNDILCIKNDAIFTFRKLEDVTQFDNVKFTLRNRYTLFCRIYRMELFYLFDAVNDNEVLDIKGMNNENYKLHEPYMIDFIKTLFKTFQTDQPEEAIMLLRNFYENYINRRYPVGYYRELDSGTFRMNKMAEYLNFKATIATPQILPMIDINTNGSFLRQLSKILYTEYLRGR